MTFKASNVDFQIFFIYGPSEYDNPAFFENIQTSSDPNCASLVLGDWNVVMDIKKTGLQQKNIINLYLM